jgi:hypothetical protein
VLRERQDHTVLLTVPAKIERLERHITRPGTPVGMEVWDGSPHGLDQTQRDHQALTSIMQRGNFAPVSGSNTHGWSHTPGAWTLLRIPGWRDLMPAALGARVETLLREDRFRATRVVERHGADRGATPLGLATTLPAALWHVLATLTLAERLSFRLWLWGLTLAVRWLRRTM